MKLLVGLGNPGGEYAGHRHNVGFMALDAIHAEWRGNHWRRKFQSEIAEASVGDTRMTLVKPLTYMNESGRAVADVARFYKVKLGDILVAHDEIDLAPGKFRMKTGGGTGGHNGLKSISAHMGDGYRRLRIGVGHPGRKELVPAYVLHDFAKADHEWLEPLLDAFAREAPLLTAGDDQGFANKVRARLGSRPQSRETAPGQGSRPSAEPVVERSTRQEPAGPFAVLKGLIRK